MIRKPIRKISDKMRRRNAMWRRIVLQRADYLREKYGFIVCEYSGESILALSSVGEYLNDGWGHHIDGNRNHCTPENCYIVKYKYHGLIEDNNIIVTQEDFKGVIQCQT